MAPAIGSLPAWNPEFVESIPRGLCWKATCRREVEEKLLSMCETCGSLCERHNLDGWIKTVCEEHRRRS
jgi:hypothetical protein